jgi:nucleotide-binding universal stress UspA family protein
MRNPVVVGVTGTPAGLAAVRLAAREAVSRACQLRVVHAFTWPSPTGDLGYETARRAASRAVEDAVATAKRSTPRVRVSGQLVDGSADRVLVQLSRGAELLVLGDDDLATTPWLPSSSVLVQTVARAWCSVLVARGPRPPAGPVLVAVDGSACSLLALRQATAEGRRRKAVVEVVHVKGDKPLDDIPELRNTTVRVLAGPAGAALVHASGQARVLVLGPRGTRGSGLLGSVAREVLHHATCPTVFVHGGAIPAQRAAPLELTTAY